MKHMKKLIGIGLCVCLIGLLACEGEKGTVGPQGVQGPQGPQGDKGDKGANGIMPPSIVGESVVKPSDWLPGNSEGPVGYYYVYLPENAITKELLNSGSYQIFISSPPNNTVYYPLPYRIGNTVRFLAGALVYENKGYLKVDVFPAALHGTVIKPTTDINIRWVVTPGK
jgi:hypothetical protein